jgi:hypothetical protein
MREQERKVTQIWLQHNNKYSFDSEQPGLILNFLVALYKSGRGYMSLGEGADWAITPLLGLTFDDLVVFQHITENVKITKNSRGEGANWAITPLLGLRNELWPLPEPRFSHRENYYRPKAQIIKNSTGNRLFFLKWTCSVRVVAMSELSNGFKKHTLWDYPFKPFAE